MYYLIKGENFVGEKWRIFFPYENSPRRKNFPFKILYSVLLVCFLEWSQAPSKVYNVAQGKKYRFRVIGSGLLTALMVSVDGHQISVVATDGYEVCMEDYFRFSYTIYVLYSWYLCRDRNLLLQKYFCKRWYPYHILKGNMGENSKTYIYELSLQGWTWTRRCAIDQSWRALWLCHHSRPNSWKLLDTCSKYGGNNQHLLSDR